MTLFLQTFSSTACLPSPSQLVNVAMVKGSSGVAEGKLKARKKKEWKPSISAETAGLGERCTTVQKAPCELCGGIFPQPITYHMRQVRKRVGLDFSLP